MMGRQHLPETSKASREANLKGDQTVNQVQNRYAGAKARHDAIKATNDQREAEFCAAHSYTTRDGNPALHVWMIDDKSIFEVANREFSALHQVDYNEEIKAQEALEAAEDALIEWSLSILPANMQQHVETLRNEAKRRIKVRDEMIDLAFRLDARTIKMA